MQVHRGMGAALEIMRASQLDLAAMDEGASPPPVSLPAEGTPEAPAFQASGNRLLSLLQVGLGYRVDYLNLRFLLEARPGEWRVFQHNKCR